MVSVRVEVERLSHKDVRQRRRAIRHLFELNDPFALSGFLPFLDSDDVWFVDQSIEAVRRWDDGSEISLLERLSNHSSRKVRLLSLEVCVRYDDSDIALSKLRNDSDSIVSKRAWVISLRHYSDSQFKKIVDDGLNSEFVNIRRATIESANLRNLEQYVLQGLSDSAPSVISKSIEGLSLDSHGIEEIREFISHTSSVVAVAAYRRLNYENALNFQDTVTLLSNPSGEAIEAVVGAFSDGIEWADEDIIDFLLSVPSESLIPRLVRRSPKNAVDPVRAKLILGPCSEFRKIRYLEDLIGRKLGLETLSSVKTISEGVDEGPLRDMALEVLEDQKSLGREEVRG